MRVLSAGHIGEDWMDSDAFCELQPIIGLTSRYDRFDEWENVEHRNLIPAEPAKSTMGRLILMNCEVMDEDLVRMDVGTDGSQRFEVTPLVIPVIAHLDSVRSLLKW